MHSTFPSAVFRAVAHSCSSKPVLVPSPRPLPASRGAALLLLGAADTVYFAVTAFFILEVDQAALPALCMQLRGQYSHGHQVMLEAQLCTIGDLGEELGSEFVCRGRVAFPSKFLTPLVVTGELCELLQAQGNLPQPLASPSSSMRCDVVLVLVSSDSTSNLMVVSGKYSQSRMTPLQPWDTGSSHLSMVCLLASS